jgi:hypothetical protein
LIDTKPKTFALRRQLSIEMQLHPTPLESL